MDKIYSRVRVKLPRIIYSGGNDNKKTEKVIRIIMILVIAILVMTNTLNAIDPIFNTVCKNKAESIVTIEVNRITTLNIDKYQEYEMITVEEDEEENIQLLQWIRFLVFTVRQS